VNVELGRKSYVVFLGLFILIYTASVISVNDRMALNRKV